jgi:hypothetical protein
LPFASADRFAPPIAGPCVDSASVGFEALLHLRVRYSDVTIAGAVEPDPSWALFPFEVPLRSRSFALHYEA